MREFPVEFTVEGAGEFPVDMLRYDRCWPASEVDSARLQYGARDALGRSRREVRLVARFAGKRPRTRLGSLAEVDPRAVGLTPARWASFGWRIVSATVLASAA